TAAPVTLQPTVVFGASAAVKPLSFIFPSVHSVCVYSAFGVPPKLQTSPAAAGIVGFIDFRVCSPGVNARTSARHIVLLMPPVTRFAPRWLFGQNAPSPPCCVFGSPTSHTPTFAA